MEIVLKTKQKDNPQFEFLNYDSDLNPYFKHLVSVMKDGRYVPPAASTVQPETPEDDGHSYLHPSLTSASQPEPELAPMTSQEFLESIKSKLPAGQIANTSYQVLLKNLQKHAMPVAAPKPLDLPLSDRSVPVTVKPSLLKPPPPPPPPLAPPLAPGLASTRSESPGPSTALQTPHPTVESAALITPPPPDQKPIIDKMADYVARNGPEFEACVKLKNDARFQFLSSGHVHHNYYVYKKNICVKELEKLRPPPAEEEDEPETEKKEAKADDELESDTNETSDGPSLAEEPSDSTASKASLTIKGVSFSIKTKEEEVTSLKTRTALLYDTSDEDDSNSDIDKESQSMSRNSSRVSLATATTTSEKPTMGENYEKKQAEQKLADRLASAAREKLARESRERQLQAQRKRKAALFINMLKDSNSAPSPSSGPSASSVAAAAAALADFSGAPSAVDSPFNSSTKSGSVTPTALLEQAALDLSRASVVPASVPSRARSRSPRRHRNRSVTPPSAYTANKRSSSKSPSRHIDHSRSKHRSKHSDGRKHESPTHLSRSSHKKSTKDRESSKHKKSKKSKSKHRRSESRDDLDDDFRPKSKRPRVASSISKVNPIVVDLTGGSPRAGDDGSKRSERSSSKHFRR